MPQASYGSTSFNWPDTSEPGAKVKIATAEGSTVAVPYEDLLLFVYHAYVIPGRQMRDLRKDWKEGLLG